MKWTVDSLQLLDCGAFIRAHDCTASFSTQPRSHCVFTAGLLRPYLDTTAPLLRLYCHNTDITTLACDNATPINTVNDEFNSYRVTHAKRNCLSSLPTVNPPAGFNLDRNNGFDFDMQMHGCLDLF